MNPRKKICILAGALAVLFAFLLAKAISKGDTGGIVIESAMLALCCVPVVMVLRKSPQEMDMRMADARTRQDAELRSQSWWRIWMAPVLLLAFSTLIVAGHIANGRPLNGAILLAAGPFAISLVRLLSIARRKRKLEQGPDRKSRS
ncbi:hypothetical protein [Streptomyces sp. ODS28]|uniref:hypothetical protein n=1 Tax=Streptomyces sp. ODS28 TaxID=3136688 RepID=UPI0031EB61A2